MNITVLESGFVTGDFLKPVGYEGERNSRSINIVHPHFKDCYYQIVVKRYDGAYKLGITDGVAAIPPSLLRTATDLQCQFIALSTPESVEDTETDTFVFMSNPFTLKVAKGLDLGRTEVIPTYEELQEMYKQVKQSQLIVNQSKSFTENVLQQINEILVSLRLDPIKELSEECLENYRRQLEDITSEYIESELIDQIVEEVLTRIPKCGPLCKMTLEELDERIREVAKDMKREVKQGSASWIRTAYSLNRKGNVVGGR